SRHRVPAGERPGHRGHGRDEPEDPDEDGPPVRGPVRWGLEPPDPPVLSRTGAPAPTSHHPCELDQLDTFQSERLTACTTTSRFTFSEWRPSPARPAH